MRIPLIGLSVAGLALSACAYGGYYGSGYGYGGGYNSYYPAYSLSSYYYPSYYGWYGDRYYPGTGIYVYDTYRRPYRMSDSQRRYWTTQRARIVSSSPAISQRRVVRQNWSGFNRDRVVRTERANNRDRRKSRQQ